MFNFVRKYPMEKCYCGNNVSKQNCCQPLLDGKDFAKTAEQLMRSRYSAYATGNIDYILSTHHHSTRPTKERRDILNWTLSVNWLGLTVHSTKNGTSNDTFGFVKFTALFLEQGKMSTIEENSHFLKENNRWYYAPI